MAGVTKSAPTHAPVTLGVGSDPALALAGQELTLAPGAAHAPVTLGPGSDLALTLVGQQLTLADVLTPAEHTAIGDAAPHHAPVTIAGGSDPALSLLGQQLALADVLTPAEHTAIGNGAPHHAPVTIGADTEHSLVGQVLSGVDAAAAQKGHIQLAGELMGTAALPTVTAIHSGSAHHAAITLGGGSDAALALAGQQLTLADVLTPAEHTAIGDAAPHHAPVTIAGGSDPALSLVGQQLTLADVLTPAEHTAIGDAAPHHAEAHTLASHSTKAHSELTGIGSSDHHTKYTNAEAIAAVEGEATLDLAGDVTIAKTLKWDASNMNFTNLLSNGDFEVGDPPTSWTLVTSGGGSYSRSTTQVKIGSYSAKITCGLNENWNWPYQSIANYAYYKGRTVTLGAWVWAAVANRVYLNIYDGVSYGWSAFHPGDSAWHWITATRAVDATATQLILRVPQIDLGAVTSAYADGAILVEGETCPAFANKPLGAGSVIIDARCDDAINSGDATTDGVIDALRDAMIAHGLIGVA